ncbi:hypothetical protein [Thermovenabulum gondwanense]|uniref:Uncharacterized protein n=1 Tax=Thermovenabulum gondwanense TaxID=520767 RepID=A0A162MRF2_9FIRM|nr:hypothetical protein [Thermovenabulum gondwanense]KYO67000.1 hypothetical protein ATZ99_08170 [Thermovenabulum gondwanense]
MLTTKKEYENYIEEIALAVHKKFSDIITVKDYKKEMEICGFKGIYKNNDLGIIHVEIPSVRSEIKDVKNIFIRLRLNDSDILEDILKTKKMRKDFMDFVFERHKEEFKQNSTKMEWKCIKPHSSDIRIEKRIHICKNKGLPPKEEIIEPISILAKIDLLDDLRAWEKERLPLFSIKTKIARIKQPL